MDVSSATAGPSLAQLQANGNAMINKRLATLQTLETSVSNDKTLTSADSTALMTELQNSTTGLTALQSTMAGETDPSKVKADIMSAVQDYRVYRLVQRQVHSVEAADRAESRIASLQNEMATAQAKIQAEAANGTNVDTLNSQLQAAQADLANVDPTLGNVSSSVLALKPSDITQQPGPADAQLTSALQMAHAANRYAAQAGTVMSQLLSELG